MNFAMHATLAALTVLVLIRGFFVHRHAIRRLREIRDHNLTRIDNANALIDYAELPLASYAEPERKAFGHMLDLRLWTYRQFYPEVLAGEFHELP